MPPVLELSSANDTPIFTLRLRDPVLKTGFGALYNGKKGEWWFPAFYPAHKYALSSLKKLVPGLTLSQEAQMHVQELDKELQLPESFEFITLPYEHQRLGVLHAYRHLRAGLFYDPGLGKCKITVDVQRLLQEPMLIICPRIMVDTWKREFDKHGHITDVQIINGATKAKKLKQIASAAERVPIATVMTYGVAALYPEEVLKIPYRIMVIDESHRIKQPQAKRTKAITVLGQRAYRRILLSGTPSLGSPFDLYSQLRFLGTYFCPENWWQFRKKFGVFPAYEAQERVPKMLLGFRNLDTMNRRVNSVCLRKTREECLDLPPRLIIDVPVNIEGAQKTMYNEMATTQAYGAGVQILQDIVTGRINHKTGTTLAPHALAQEHITLLGKLEQASGGFLYLTQQNPALCDGCEHMVDCAHQCIKPYTNRCKIAPRALEVTVESAKSNARLDACTDLVETILADGNNKVIIWATFQQEMRDIAGMLTRLGINYVRVQGGTSDAQLKHAVDSFNDDPKVSVYLAQVATGIGITLNSAKYMIYYSLPWSLEHYLQSMDRNYRIGQKTPVTVYRILGNHTLDESKALALEQKVDFMGLITSQAQCATCSEYFKRCKKYNVKLFSDDCILDTTVERVTATVGIIP